jgi:hypothetical protein
VDDVGLHSHTLLQAPTLVPSVVPTELPTTAPTTSPSTTPTLDPTTVRPELVRWC